MWYHELLFIVQLGDNGPFPSKIPSFLLLFYDMYIIGLWQKKKIFTFLNSWHLYLYNLSYSCIPTYSVEHYSSEGNITWKEMANNVLLFCIMQQKGNCFQRIQYTIILSLRAPLGLSDTWVCYL